MFSDNYFELCPVEKDTTEMICPFKELYKNNDLSLVILTFIS